MRKIHFFLLLTSLFFLAGCGGGGVKPVPVTGKVTLDGKDISSFPNFMKGSVTFLSEKGSPAYGDIQPDGSFQMKTDNKPGVPAGSYKVTVRIISTEVPPSRFNDAEPVLLSAKKYNNEETSGLTREVPSGGIKNMMLDITSK